MLWNEDNIKCEVLHSTEQEIHACIQVSPHISPWFISAIYASPCFERRKLLWENLKVFAQRRSLRWLVLGDCNQVLSAEDKFGGNPINIGRASLFNKCLDTFGLVDLGFSGPRYTWSNLRVLGGLIQEHLDTCWSNSSWKIMFPNTAVRHLPRTQSDHSPVLLNTNPYISSFSKPFHFKSIWFSDPSISSLTDDCRKDPESSFNSNLKCGIGRILVIFLPKKINFGPSLGYLVFP